MYQVIFENNHIINISINLSQNYISGNINNQPFVAELHQISNYEYLIKHNNAEYNILLLSFDTKNKTISLKINGKRASVQVKDKYDLILQRIGMGKIKAQTAEVIKSPMPGKILNILVSEGQAVKKGDTLLILEAMKMENVLKSPVDGVIKKILVMKGSSVEKNQLLLEL